MRAFIASLSSIISLNTGKPDDFKTDKRKIIIPLYQREFQWNDDMINTLLADIDNSTKFLGNIILDEKEDRYEIIDGQQRITTCMLIIAGIYNFYSSYPREQSNIMRLICPEEHLLFHNYSFEGFLKYVDNRFVLEEPSTVDADPYNQYQTFNNALTTINEYIEQFADISKLKSFYTKLKNCQFLVLIKEESETENSYSVEELFLDINEKAKPLDVESVFKGHCFRNYDIANHEELKEKWILFKKEVTKLSAVGFSDASEYIYVYLLEMKVDDIPQNLIISGKHYLQDKSEDETDRLLVDMIKYATTIIEFSAKTKMNNYQFIDLCPDSVTHIQFHEILRKMCDRMIGTEKEPLYAKLPFFTLLFYLLKDEPLRNAISHEQFHSLITNLYIYMGVFGLKGGRKNKRGIDHSIKNSIDEKSSLSVQEKATAVTKAARALRKKEMRDFSFNNEYIDWKIKFIYSVIDFFDSSRSILTKLYDSIPNITLEHFIVNKNDKIDWEIEDEEVLQFQIPDSALCKKAKKMISNYLLVNQTLNGDILCNYDIVKKIELTRKWYEDNNLELPSHIELIINSIEALPQYTDLVRFKENLERDKEKIKEKYLEFLKAYFNEEYSEELILTIQKRFHAAFKQQDNTQEALQCHEEIISIAEAE